LFYPFDLVFNRFCSNDATSREGVDNPARNPIDASVQYSTHIFATATKMPGVSAAGARLSRRCNAVVKLRVFKDL
jgi:hypothetical protein